MVRPNSGSAGDSRQLSFAASSGDGHRPVSARSKERPRSAPLDVRVRDEIAAYQRSVVRQGRSPGTADCHGGKLVAAARASERYLDRPIFSLDEIYRVDVIAAIFPMDEPAKSTIVKIRHALRDYLRTTKRDADFERACRILKEGLRRAAEPSALRYRIRRGRARQPRYVPNEMEFRAVRARCQTDGHTFVGVRDAAVPGEPSAILRVQPTRAAYQLKRSMYRSKYGTTSSGTSRSQDARPLPPLRR